MDINNYNVSFTTNAKKEVIEIYKYIDNHLD